MVENWGYHIFSELVTPLEIHYKIKISNTFFLKENKLHVYWIKNLKTHTIWMVKINWEMMNVRIVPFIGTRNIIYFSVNGILRCIKVLQGWYKNYVEPYFSESVYCGGEKTQKTKTSCTISWKNNQVSLDSFIIHFSSITWWSSFPLSLFLKEAMLI